MATVKQILQNVADAVGITRPEAFVGSTDDTPKRLLRAYSAAGRHLAQRPWRALTFEHTFTTSSSVQTYALPTSPAFSYLLNSTAYDQGNFRPLVGPENPAGWQYGNAMIISEDGITQTFRIKRDDAATPRADKIYLLDDPGGSYTLAFEYVTTEWIYDGSSAYYTDVQADANESLLDDYLMELETTWRMLRALGEPYFDEKDEAMRRADQKYAQENQRTLDLRARSRRLPTLYPEFVDV